MLIGYRKNDGGRKEAGFKGRAGDCVCRAIAIATGRPYREVYDAIASINQELGLRRSAREGVSNKGMLRVMQHFGFEKHPQKGVQPTYTQAYREYGDCIVSTNGHVCALIDGSLHDTFDGRLYRWEGEVRSRKARTVWTLKEEKR